MEYKLIKHMFNTKIKGDSMKYNYEELLDMADVKSWDSERKSFFYIIANNDELNSRLLKIWDFDRNTLKNYKNEENEIRDFTGDEEFIQMGSTAKKLLRVAISLYNGRECDLFNTFGYLNRENYLLVLKALEMRFYPSE